MIASARPASPPAGTLLAREAAEAALAPARRAGSRTATARLRLGRAVDGGDDTRGRQLAKLRPEASRLSAPAARRRRTRSPTVPRWPRPPRRRCRTRIRRSWRAPRRAPTPPAWSASPASRPRRQRDRATAEPNDLPARLDAAEALHAPRPRRSPRPNRLSPPPPPSRQAPRARQADRLTRPRRRRVAGRDADGPIVRARRRPSRRRDPDGRIVRAAAAAESPGATRRPNRPSPAAESPEPAGPEVMSPAGPPQRERSAAARRARQARPADPAAAGGLLAGLLPAQGSCRRGSAGVRPDHPRGGSSASTFDGAARCRPGARAAAPAPRSRFHLTADALTRPRCSPASTIAWAGSAAACACAERRAATAAARARVRRPRPDRAARAGARLEPAPAWQALAYAVHPSWTSGLVFTVASTVAEERGA